MCRLLSIDRKWDAGDEMLLHLALARYSELRKCWIVPRKQKVQLAVRYLPQACMGLMSKGTQGASSMCFHAVGHTTESGP